MTTISSDAAGRREASRSSDGKFGHQTHSESDVSLAALNPAPQQNVYSVPGPDKPLTPQDAPLSHYELGLRTNEQGSASIRMLTELGGAGPHNQSTWDEADDLMPQGSYARGFNAEPISVVDGKVVVEVTVSEVDRDELQEDEESEFNRGRADRAAWIRRPDSRHEHVDSALFFQDDDHGYLERVPEMPEGTPEGVSVGVWQDDERHIAELTQNGKQVARYVYIGTDNEYADPGRDFAVGSSRLAGEESAPAWVQENRDDYEEVLRVVAENHYGITDLAISRARWTKGFDERAAQLALAGNPDAESGQ